MKNQKEAYLKVTLLCPLEKIWNKVTDLKDFSWRSNLKDMKVIDDRNFLEIYKDGEEKNCKIKEIKAGESILCGIENKVYKGTFLIEFYKTGTSTTIYFTEKIKPKKFFINISAGKRAQYLKEYLEDLKKELACKEADFS